MVSVEEAKELISANCFRTPALEISLVDASALTLAEDVFSPIDLPPFNQSSMDGYAIAFADLAAGAPLQITGTLPAGSKDVLRLERNCAIRIFTGAPLPQDADTVVMQEHVKVQDGQMIITSPALERGSNTRPAGAEIKKGDLALPAGITLTASAIGYLSGMGITHVKVYSKARVALLITGNELREPGTPLDAGQVYESSSYALRAALSRLPAEVTAVRHLTDDAEKLTAAVKELLPVCDVLLVTGGVSVGDFDFTEQACSQAGVEKIFHRVKQKPGKPLYFGKSMDKLVFGMPGNPSSVLTCFYQYVAPAIEQLCSTRPSIRETIATFSGEYQKSPGLTHFLKGVYDQGEVRQSGAQESYRLSSFAVSNCLIELEENTEQIANGNSVRVYILNE